MTITRSEILANRTKWIKYLKRSDRQKGGGKLDRGGGYRCCLGHACYILGIQREKEIDGTYSYGASLERNTAPIELVDMVGLWDDIGNIKFSNINLSLMHLNDATDYTPKMIGEYLESVIEGGKNTVFRPLSDYPDD